MQRIINFVVLLSSWFTVCSDSTLLFKQEHWTARILPGATVYSKHAYHVWLCISSIHLQMWIRRSTEQFDCLTGLSWAVKNFKTCLCSWADLPLIGKLKDLKCIFTWSITLNNSKAMLTLLKDPLFSNRVVQLKSRCLHHWITVFINQVILLFKSAFFEAVVRKKKKISLALS